MTADWTDPKTWAVGEKLRAVDLNTHLRDNLRYLYSPPSLILRRTSNQPIPHATDTPVEWSEALRDEWDMWDDGSPETIVIPQDGTYFVDGNFLWGGPATGRRAIFLERDGQRLRGEQGPASSPTEQGLQRSTTAAEDSALQIVVRQTAGESIDLISALAPTRAPVLFIYRVLPPIS